LKWADYKQLIVTLTSVIHTMVFPSIWTHFTNLFQWDVTNDYNDTTIRPKNSSTSLKSKIVFKNSKFKIEKSTKDLEKLCGEVQEVWKYVSLA